MNIQYYQPFVDYIVELVGRKFQFPAEKCSTIGFLLLCKKLRPSVIIVSSLAQAREQPESNLQMHISTKIYAFITYSEDTHILVN